MQGMKVGGLIREQMLVKLKLKVPPPIICPNCVRPCHVDSYVIARPEEAHCLSCSFRWTDLADYAPMCANCGYSADHREGLGCQREDG